MKKASKQPERGIVLHPAATSLRPQKMLSDELSSEPTPHEMTSPPIPSPPILLRVKGFPNEAQCTKVTRLSEDKHSLQKEWEHSTRMHGQGQEHSHSHILNVPSK